MTRVLLVTQAARALGQFRRPWVRAAYRRFVERHRRAVARACACVDPHVDLTVLTSRELIDPALLPAGATVRYYEDEAHKLDAEHVSRLTSTFADSWWPERGTAPELEYRGVWLPDVIVIRRAITIRLELAQVFGIVERAVHELTPARLLVMTGASVPERIARTLAQARGLRVEVAQPRFVSARLYARMARALLRHDEEQRLREFLEHPRCRPSTAPSAPPVLFVTARPRHHFVVDPLAEALRAADVPTYALGSADPDLTRPIAALRDAGTPAAFISDYVTAAEARRLIARHRPRFRAVWRRLSSDPAFERALRWNGVPVGAIARPFRKDAVEIALMTALLYQEAASRAVEALAPAAVALTSNRRLIERTVALTAQARRIPTLIFSNTLLMPSDRELLSFGDIADRLLVMGDHLRDRLIRELALPDDRVTVLGDVRSDRARRTARPVLRAEIEKKFGIGPGRRLVVLVSKYVSKVFSSDEKERLYRTVHAATAGMADVDVVVKIHPNEDPALVSRQAGEWGWPDAKLTQENDIHALFRAADAAIMVTSMAGVEAMAMGCPVIALQPLGRDLESESSNMPPYVKEGAVELVSLDDPSSVDMLVGALRRILNDAAARQELIERGHRFAAQYVRPLDGRLAQRFLAIADEARVAVGARRA